MIQLGASILFGKQVEDFEEWAKSVMAEILVELVVVIILAVTFAF